MPGLISGRELMERWGITPYELLHRFIKQGLIAYNEAGQEVSPAEIIHGTDEHTSEHDKIMAWHDYELPGGEAEAQQMIQALGGLYFNEGNLHGFEGIFDLTAGKKPGKNAPAKKSVRLHHTKVDKMRVQSLALELLEGKYKGYTVPELAQTPEIRHASQKKPGGVCYALRKRKEWINEVLPPEQRLKGAPKKEE